MSDDVRIPELGMGGRERAPLSNGHVSAASYRARRPGMEHGLVKLAAAGVGGLLLLGAVGYSVMGRRSSTVPVIEADSRPIRVKPDNPGGMQVAGADEMSDERTGRDKMAPSAEVPAPQALRAQMQQAEPAQAAAPTQPAQGATPAAAPAATATPKPGTPGASPLPDTPARPLAKATAPAASAPSPAHVAGGVTMVQLGALSSEVAARSEWQRLGHILPGLLDGREPTVTKVARDGRTYWRLRTGGFTDIADATEFCTKLKAKGSTCAIASF